MATLARAPSSRSLSRTKASKSVMGGGELTEQMLREAFGSIDMDGGGTLDRDEIRLAMHRIGKTEGEIETVLGNMKQDELSFEEFKAKARSWVAGRAPSTAVLSRKNSSKSVVKHTSGGTFLTDLEMADRTSLRHVKARVSSRPSAGLKAEINRIRHQKLYGKQGHGTESSLELAHGPPHARYKMLEVGQHVEHLTHGRGIVVDVIRKAYLWPI